MPELPSGTVTFLFTDIERSTRSAETLGDERWADALQIHHDLLRPCFEKHGGVEVGTEGDAFFVAFPRAADAVRAALAAQRALESSDWPGESRIRVRIGMHTGEALVRGDNYVGYDVHKAKRVSHAAHGGQILVSQTTADLVSGNVDLVGLGPHRLKDVGEPQRVFQVVADDLQRDFPPLRTLDAASHNLPVQLTSFVGRERELEEVAEKVRAHRLVTLTGVGGCGKTRLAIQAAAGELESFADGVFFCDLSRVSDEGAIAPAVAQALGIDLVGQGIGEVAARRMSAAEVVRSHLATRRVLLILDNCEHVVASVAEFVEDLLISCPHLRVLATSREALEVSGEHAWSVPSLTTSGEAAQLFAERAAAVRGGFAVNAENADDIGAICERLDGIPLAIELAAAQVGHLGPRQIAERLDDRFMILTGGRRRVQRQQTLQAAMDWSWELLEDTERVLLRRLSVFQGGCTLEAAEAVCGAGIDTVAGLRALVAKSLVVADEQSGVSRYRLLETVRLYGETKLAESDEGTEIREKHMNHFVDWTESHTFLEAVLFTTGPTRRAIEAESANMSAALRWAESAGRHDLIARLLCGAPMLWLASGADGFRRASAALTTDLDPRLRGKLLSGLAWLEVGTTGAASGADHAQEAIRLLGDEPSPWLWWSLLALSSRAGIEAILSRDPAREADAVATAERGVEIGRALGPQFEAVASWLLGSTLQMLLRHSDAAHAYARAAQELTGSGPFSQIVEGLAVSRHILGDEWPADLELHRRAAIERLEAGGRTAAFSFALVCAERGDHGRARATLFEWATEIGQPEGQPLLPRLPLVYEGVNAGIEQKWERAARLLAAAMQPGIIIRAPAYALYRFWVPRVREMLPPERARQLRDEGRAMSLNEALAYAFEGRDR